MSHRPFTKESTRYRRWARMERHLRKHPNDTQTLLRAAELGRQQVGRTAQPEAKKAGRK